MHKWCAHSRSQTTLAFFQLEMHGGIFHSCCSLTVTLRFGECITGAGGDGGPFGIFLFVLQQTQQSCHQIKNYHRIICILSKGADVTKLSHSGRNRLKLFQLYTFIYLQYMPL